jgi:N-dimethylarginine dimethylaminohydrolase
MKATRSEKLIIIDECQSDLLDNLDGLAYSRLSGDGALVIHTSDLAVTPGERASQENIQKVIDCIKDSESATVPDAFVLLRRW